MTDEDSFALLLESLLADDDVSFTDELSSLSDLDPTQLERFQPIWDDLTPQRRRLLLSALGQQALDHIELQFDRVNSMALKDPDAGVRRIAIGNLWESHDPKLALILLKITTSDPFIDVRIAAIQALGRFVLLGQLSKIGTSLLAKIEDALLHLLEMDDVVDLHRAAIEALGYSSRPELEGIIQAAYASSDEGLRQSSLLAMGRSANELWEEPILAELESYSPELRYEAARAAGELELRSTVLCLVELLDDVNDSVRTGAIWSLGQIGGRKAQEALEALQASLDSDEIAPRLEEALEHIAFLESTPDFVLFDFDQDEDELY